jgi:hypothetical protein
MRKGGVNPSHQVFDVIQTVGSDVHALAMDCKKGEISHPNEEKGCFDNLLLRASQNREPRLTLRIFDRDDAPSL